MLLRQAKIDFLTRLPAGRILYKNLILNHTENLETIDQTYQYGKRSLFIKRIKIDLYGSAGYAYIVLNPNKKAKDLEVLISSKNHDEVLSEKEKKYRIV